MNMYRRISLLFVACGLLASCREEVPALYNPKNPEVMDTELNLTRKDYNNLLNTVRQQSQDPNVSFKVQGGDGPPIPDLAPILAAPQPPKLGQTKLVSVTVTDDVPLKDLLLELARLADVDIEVDAGITGGIAFRAKDRPFNEVIERIADVAGLRYAMNNGILRVERDSPYVETYSIDFINIERSSSGSVTLSTNVLSGGGGTGGTSGGGGGGLNSGSNSSINSKSDSDFWKQLEEGIKNILSYKPATMRSGGGTAAAAAPAPGAPPGTSGGGEEKTFYILNKQGAALTVSGSQRQHEMIKQFLRKIEANASSQVLIEAKIVEVTLSRDFQSGIDWNKLGGSELSFTTAFSGLTTANIAAFRWRDEAVLGNKGIDLDLAVRLAETFGTTRTLSSPRLHAINNQQAVLTFAENQVYFNLKVQREQTTSAANTNSLLTVNSEIQTVPIGIIMVIQPSINSESGEVTLSVRPTLSRITGFVSDPAVAFLVSQAQAEGADLSVDSRVPVVEVRELDSILKLKSGQVMVIGGLMEDKAVNDERRMPYVSNIPVFGELFKGNNRESNTKELVIFIRATIVGADGSAQPMDKALYKKFSNDPRPIDF